MCSTPSWCISSNCSGRPSYVLTRANITPSPFCPSTRGRTPLRSSLLWGAPIAGHSLVALKDLSYELALAVARHLKALNVAGRSQQVALVVAVTLSSPGWGQLPVVGFKVLGHLLLEDLLEDGLHALANPGLHVQLHVVVELMFRGQVVSLLTQPTTYQTLSVIIIVGLIHLIDAPGDLQEAPY